MSSLAADFLEIISLNRLRHHPKTQTPKTSPNLVEVDRQLQQGWLRNAYAFKHLIGSSPNQGPWGEVPEEALAMSATQIKEVYRPE